MFDHSFHTSGVQGAKLFRTVPIITTATYHTPNYLWGVDTNHVRRWTRPFLPGRVWPRETSLGAPQRLCRCFINAVLTRTLPDRLIFAMTSPFCLASKSASWFLLLRVLSLNWIHSQMISGATFRIIGLTRISSARLDLPNK